MLTNLIDGDIIAWKCASSCQDTFNFGNIQVTQSNDKDLGKIISSFVSSLTEATGANKTIVCLSDPDANWRTKVLPTYKCNRTSERPEQWQDARSYLIENYQTYLKPTLEADDVMGILATHPQRVKGDKVICTIDKDLYQIPVPLYNWNQPRRRSYRPSQEEAEMFHMVQTLSGDITDGYGGVPYVGEKTAYKLLLEGLQEGKGLWQVILEAYGEWGMTEEDALCIARVARICQFNDYDYKRKEVILWNL